MLRPRPTAISTTVTTRGLTIIGEALKQELQPPEALPERLADLMQQVEEKGDKGALDEA